jgi:UDP-glucose:(heptosyl)LPS alpha-1,3-glucosyltransferase
VVFLFVGMNFEIKRLDLAMESLAAAMRTSTDFRPALLVAGRGDLKRYQARAEEMGVSERVTFAGVVEDMASCYASADVFFMPSRFDTFGLVVLEAMAAGLPVIITDRTGAKDIVTSGREGFVVPVDAPASEYAECMGRLMNRDRREQMGRFGRAAAAAHSWEGVASQVMDVYRSVPGRGVN